MKAAVAAERERWKPLADAVREAEADRENRGKSTVTGDHWDGIVAALERVDRSGAERAAGPVLEFIRSHPQCGVDSIANALRLSLADARGHVAALIEGGAVVERDGSLSAPPAGPGTEEGA
jgi:hypothetical protein